MSQADIDRLVAERSLVRQDFDDAQVAGYWAKARSARRDAGADGLSGDSVFQLGYTGALQATLALLASHGLRVKSSASHYKAFYTMGRLDESLRGTAARFDALRARRHESIYEPAEDEETAVEAIRALTMLDEALPLIRSSIIAARPHLTRLLPPT